MAIYCVVRQQKLAGADGVVIFAFRTREKAQEEAERLNLSNCNNSYEVEEINLFVL